jgi:hypothetical protein
MSSRLDGCHPKWSVRESRLPRRLGHAELPTADLNTSDRCVPREGWVPLGTRLAVPDHQRTGHQRGMVPSGLEGPPRVTPDLDSRDHSHPPRGATRKGGGGRTRRRRERAMKRPPTLPACLTIRQAPPNWQGQASGHPYPYWGKLLSSSRKAALTPSSARSE